MAVLYINFSMSIFEKKKDRQKKTKKKKDKKSPSNLSVEEHLVVRHRLLLEHSQDRSEEAGLLRLEHVDDVAVGSPVQGEVFDQTVLRRLNLLFFFSTNNKHVYQTVLLLFSAQQTRDQTFFFFFSTTNT